MAGEPTKIVRTLAACGFHGLGVVCEEPLAVGNTDAAVVQAGTTVRRPA